MDIAEKNKLLINLIATTWSSRSYTLNSMANCVIAMLQSEVLSVKVGYTGNKKKEKKDDKKVHVRRILIKTKPFTEWLSEKVKSASVKIYVKY